MTPMDVGVRVRSPQPTGWGWGEGASHTRWTLGFAFAHPNLRAGGWMDTRNPHPRPFSQGEKGEDPCPCLGRQGRRVLHRPQHQVSVEQHLHGASMPSKAASTSAGRGASKSSAIVISPFIKPSRIPRRGASPTGTSLAIGVPDLAITMSSPRRAASTSSESRVLASCRLSCITPPHLMACRGTTIAPVQHVARRRRCRCVVSSAKNPHPRPFSQREKGKNGAARLGPSPSGRGVGVRVLSTPSVGWR
ncbi:hypothetical protein EV699_114153 [Plasticicumulans lactativorans]|uniref:Uncharacterized protein n=1 Tax=Plasticicumulans lactativorans TaxID=1133106 RepID=A0A4R2L8S5_9GAMM|nr:hypothetical protein EV699_114153 [Plasticicumulans lactativorans]